MKTVRLNEHRSPGTPGFLDRLEPSGAEEAWAPEPFRDVHFVIPPIELILIGGIGVETHVQ
jgi:hypothetical protein